MASFPFIRHALMFGLVAGAAANLYAESYITGAGNTFVGVNYDYYYVRGDRNQFNNSGVVNYVNPMPPVYVDGADNKLGEVVDFKAYGSSNVVNNNVNASAIFGSENSMGLLIGGSMYGVNIYGRSNRISTGVNTDIFGGTNSIGHAFGSTVLGANLSANNLTHSLVVSKNSKLSEVGDSYVFGNLVDLSRLGDSFILGSRILINGSEYPNSLDKVYTLGNELILSKAAGQQRFEGILVMGFYNQNTPLLSATMATDNSPLFVLGNGKSDTERSNAIVVEKSGRMTLTSRNYIAPTAQVPAPTQPEVLVVEGSATLKGGVVLSQRQGDIWMGDFGRAEDRGPAGGQ